MRKLEKPAEKRRKINQEEWKRVIPAREAEEKMRKEKINQRQRGGEKLISRII